MLPPYLGSRSEGFELATFSDLVGTDKSNDLEHLTEAYLAKWSKSFDLSVLTRMHIHTYVRTHAQTQTQTHALTDTPTHATTLSLILSFSVSRTHTHTVCGVLGCEPVCRDETPGEPGRNPDVL